MRITGRKTSVASVSRTNFVLVKLYTDAGIDGVGEATLEWEDARRRLGPGGVGASTRRPQTLSIFDGEVDWVHRRKCVDNEEESCIRGGCSSGSRSLPECVSA